MVEPNELDELREFVDEAIETIDMTSGPRRPPVSRLVIGMHCESPSSEMHCHLVISARVFCVTVNDHHHSARLVGRQPRSPVAIPAIGEFDLGFTPPDFVSHSGMTRFPHPRPRFLNLLEISDTTNPAAPEIAGNPLRLSETPDIVRQDETSGVDVTFDRRQISGQR
jgi:hypothetical protein